MLQILQNGLHGTMTAMSESAVLEKNANEQFSTSFDEMFQSATTEENLGRKNEVSMTEKSEEVETEDFSDVMQVKEDCDSEKKNEKVAEKKINKNENEKKSITTENAEIKHANENVRIFDKSQLQALLSKNQEKKSNVNLEVNLERLPKDFSLKVKTLLAKKSDSKANIEEISREVGTLLLSYFQMKDKNGNKKVTSETFSKNISDVALKDGKLILKGTENLKQLKIVGKVEANAKDNKENQLSVGLKELLFSMNEKTAKVEKTENTDLKNDNKLEALSVNNTKAKSSRIEKNIAGMQKDKVQKTASIQTKDVLEMKNEIKENFSMPINNKQVSSEELTRSFQEQKTSLYEQVTKQTKVLLTSDKVSFSTFIRPEEIGRVDFKFVTKDGKVNGKIILQNQEAADLFRVSVEDLRAVFQRSNVELDKLEIQIAGRQNFETGNFDFSGNSNNTGDRNTQSQEKTATVGLHQAVKAFDEGAVAIEKNIYSGNGIHLVI
jgi:hypothetical protein